MSVNATPDAKLNPGQELVVPLAVVDVDIDGVETGHDLTGEELVLKVFNKDRVLQFEASVALGTIVLDPDQVTNPGIATATLTAPNTSTLEAGELHQMTLVLLDTLSKPAVIADDLVLDVDWPPIP